MKVFVAHLRRETLKKERFCSAWKGLEYDVEFVDAVDGSLLKDDYISQVVLNYPDIKLTKGEIGCALTHLSIYKKIVKDKIPAALVLEDDACPVSGYDISEINAYLKEIDSRIRELKNSVLFVQECFYDCTKNKEKIELPNGLVFYKLGSRKYAWNGHGYVITYGAAKRLVNFLLPIRYEADCWRAFMIGANIKVWACVPHIVGTNDEDKTFSSLEAERQLTIVERRKVRKQLINREIELREAREQSRIFPLSRFIKRKLEKIKSTLLGMGGLK